MLEEIALPLNCKKNNFTKKDFFKYFAIERLGLNQATIIEIIEDFERAFPKWQELISKSFLSPLAQEKYLNLLKKRRQQLEW